MSQKNAKDARLGALEIINKYRQEAGVAEMTAQEIWPLGVAERVNEIGKARRLAEEARIAKEERGLFA